MKLHLQAIGTNVFDTADPPRPVASCGGWSGRSPEECQAVARLFAAAPEMLALLEECYAWYAWAAAGNMPAAYMAETLPAARDSCAAMLAKAGAEREVET